MPVSSEVFIHEADLPARAWSPRYATYSGGELFVADGFSSQVLVFDETGRYLRSFGKGRGEGPGELLWPGNTQVGPDRSVWVLDPQQGRLNQFDPNGEFSSSVRTAVNGFVLLADDRVFFPPGAGADGSAAVWDGEKGTQTPVRLSFNGVTEEDAKRSGNDEMMSQLTSLPSRWLASRDSAGNVVLVDNNEGTAWRIRSADWQVRQTQLPPAIVTEARERQERFTNLQFQGVRGGRLVPLSGLFSDIQHQSDGRAWLFRSSRVMLGSFLDFDARSATVVIPSEVGEPAGLSLALPLDRYRLVLFYAREARLVTLARTEVPEWLYR